VKIAKLEADSVKNKKAGLLARDHSKMLFNVSRVLYFK
jgi:hypothetical protein